MILSLISDCSHVLQLSPVLYVREEHLTCILFCVHDKGTMQIYVSVETIAIADRSLVNSESLHTWVKAKQTAGFALQLLTSCGSAIPVDFLFHCLTTYRNRKPELEDNNNTCTVSEELTSVSFAFLAFVASNWYLFAYCGFAYFRPKSGILPTRKNIIFWHQRDVKLHLEV